MNWSYPPGVRGNERELAGWPPCTNCGHDIDEHDGLEGACGSTDELTVGCLCYEYTDEPPERDPDRARDERMGR